MFNLYKYMLHSWKILYLKVDYGMNIYGTNTYVKLWPLMFTNVNIRNNELLIGSGPAVIYIDNSGNKFCLLENDIRFDFKYRKLFKLNENYIQPLEFDVIPYAIHYQYLLIYAYRFAAIQTTSLNLISDGYINPPPYHCGGCKKCRKHTKTYKQRKVIRRKTFRKNK